MTLTDTPRRPWLTALLCLLIFAAGGVVGGGTALIVVGERIQSAFQEPERMPERLTARLSRQLDLDALQAERVRQVLEGRQRRLANLREENLRRVRPALLEMEDEVAGVLDPGQARRWRSRFADFRRRWMPPPDGAGRPLRRR